MEASAIDPALPCLRLELRNMPCYDFLVIHFANFVEGSAFEEFVDVVIVVRAVEELIDVVFKVLVVREVVIATVVDSVSNVPVVLEVVISVMVDVFSKVPVVLEVVIGNRGSDPLRDRGHTIVRIPNQVIIHCLFGGGPVRKGGSHAANAVAIAIAEKGVPSSLLGSLCLGRQVPKKEM